LKQFETRTLPLWPCLQRQENLSIVKRMA
jgi:hypothetical protein